MVSSNPSFEPAETGTLFDMGSSPLGVANRLYQQARFTEAETVLLDLIEQAEANNRLDAHLATAFNNLGLTCSAQKQFEKAETAYQKAILLYIGTLGNEHPELAICLNNLAVLSYTQKKFRKAESIALKALAIREKHQDTYPLDTATSLHNLALIYHAQDKDVLALPLCERAFRLRQQRLDPDHPAVEASLSILQQIRYQLESGGVQYTSHMDPGPQAKPASASEVLLAKIAASQQKDPKFFTATAWQFPKRTLQFAQETAKETHIIQHCRKSKRMFGWTKRTLNPILG